MAVALAMPIADTATGRPASDRRASAPGTVSSESTGLVGGHHNGRIVFEGFPKNAPGNTNEVFTIRPNGDGRKRLTHNTGFDCSPGWSPDATRIAFCKSVPKSDNPYNTEIFTMRYNGTGLQKITHDPFIDVSPDWSPSGRRIVFAALVGNDFELFTIRRDGTGRKRLTYNSAYDNAPDWSPKGNRIAYAVKKPGLDFEIFTIRPNGTDRQQVTHNKTSDRIPSYSPSGRRIAIEGKNGLYVRRVAGGGLIQVTHSGSIYGHSWSPNGKRITYAQDTGPDYEIFTIKVNGTKRRQVTHDSIENFHPDWGVRRFH